MARAGNDAFAASRGRDLMIRSPQMVSLIITTYNWKQALEVVLQSALRQTRLPDEIIVADDGSSDGTGELVRNMAVASPMPLLHSWQEDRGFRAAASRNKAIAKARGDYIILIDGDMVLEPHFVEDHLMVAREGFFVQGARVLLDIGITEETLANGQVMAGLLARGLGNRKNRLRSRLLSRLFSARSERFSGVRTCNFAFWRTNALSINGFDEEFSGWGREDSDFAVRSMNSGVKRLNLLFLAVAFHLHHPVRDREHLGVNDQLLAETICTGKVRCRLGINQYLV
jgi:glycosyltransferase involved in cell wall biosynthesis